MVLTHGPMAYGEGAVKCSLYLPFFPLPFHLLMSLSVCLSVCPATVCLPTSSSFQAASGLAEVLSWFNPRRQLEPRSNSLPPSSWDGGESWKCKREEKLMG